MANENQKAKNILLQYVTYNNTYKANGELEKGFIFD